MALINYGVLKEDQYTKADIYYPPWDLIDNNDGETLILNKSDNNEEEEKEHNKNIKDNDSVYSFISEKSLEI
jgi:hypothetical protein